jgi:ABC-type branched-subunit amino acid transport system substrate-binding protein
MGKAPAWEREQMMTMRIRTRGLAAASAMTLLLGLAACGGDSGSEDGSDGPTQNADVEFTGDPVTVMTWTAYDTDTLNVKAILDIADGAVVDINNAGGINGRELKLITCNEGADPNKAAACARQAVDEGVAAVVGGFTANGDVILPILEDAGIPWFGPPGISSAELSSANSFMLTSGVLGLAGLGAKAAADGCETVASVNYDLPSAGEISQLVDLGLASGGAAASDLIKVPPTTTDFSSIAQETADYDCAVVGTPPQPFIGIATAAQSLGSDTRYYVVPGGLTTFVTDSGGDAVEGTVTLSSFPPGDDPIWDDAKAVVGELEDDPNGGWSGMFMQNTWVAYRTFATLLKKNEDFSADGVKAALDATAAVDAEGFAPPFSFATEFPAPGLNRVVNYLALYIKVEGGKLVRDGDELVDLRDALVPAS